MNLHMTYNEILEAVEKDKLDKKLGGDLPLNPQFQQMIARYLTVGEIMENFMGIKGAASDPRHNWYADPLWMQQQQILMQKVQIAMQNQMMVQQAMMGQQLGQPGQEGGDVDDGGWPPSPPEKPEPSGDKEEDAKKAEQYQKDYDAFIQKNGQYLAKAVKDNHSLISRMILRRHQEVTEKRLKEWEDSSKKALEKIMSAIDKGKK
jgi:hypothetical protein